MDHIVIHLPFPISVNAAYVNNNKGRGRGRFKSKKLRQWLDDCDRMVQWVRPRNVVDETLQKLASGYRPRQPAADVLHVGNVGVDQLVIFGVKKP